MSLGAAAEIIRGAKRVAVLTGAGVSAESGVPTFRDADGLWEGHRVEDVATPQAFQRDPALVWKFYNLRRAALQSVTPNPGHHAFVRLERHMGVGNFTLITQNIDGLHRAAGTENLLELHGNIRLVRCSAGCPGVTDRGLDGLPDLPECEACNGLLRPHIVWFHEMLDEGVIDAAQRATFDCDCFVVAGTSAVVYPAAGLVPMAKRKAPSAKVIEINLQETAASEYVDVGLYGKSGEVLPELLDRAGVAA